MQPHFGKLFIFFQHDILHVAEALVQVVKQVLDIRVVCLLGDDIHVVEGKVLELRSDKVILSGFPRHNVCQVQPIAHSGGPIKADPQQAQEEEDHHDLQQSEEA